MEFQIPCECGEQVTVEDTSAGTEVSCSCGRSMVVPRLVELRRAAGLRAWKESTPETIVRKLEEGILPPPDCIRCGGAGTEACRLFAECERQTSARTRSRLNWEILLLTIMLPIKIFSWKTEYVESRGRDTVVPVPVRVCQGCRSRLRSHRLIATLAVLRYALLAGVFVLFFVQPGYCLPLLGVVILIWIAELLLRGWQQRGYRRLLRRVEEYETLLEEFPTARIWLEQI